MFKHTTVCRFACLFSTFFMISAPANAVTGGDVMQKMEDRERGGYIAGSVEMAAFLAKVSGDTERSACITDWYFRGGNGPDQIIQALSHFRDRAAQPVIFLMIKRQCGE